MSEINEEKKTNEHEAMEFQQLLVTSQFAPYNHRCHYRLCLVFLRLAS